MVVVHAFDPSTLGSRDMQVYEFQASMAYRVSSMTARATKRNTVRKKVQIHTHSKSKYSRHTTIMNAFQSLDPWSLVALSTEEMTE